MNFLLPKLMIHFASSFRADKIAQVLNAIDEMWGLDSLELASKLNAEAAGPMPSTVGVEHPSETSREKIVTSSSRYRRSSEFARMVFDAQSNCATCPLEIGIVEAAHKVPHSNEESNNDVQNGITIWANHHTMFDTRLLALSKGLTIEIHRQRIDYLRTIKLGYRSDNILNLDGATLKLPTEAISIEGKYCIGKYCSRCRLGVTDDAS